MPGGRDRDRGRPLGRASQATDAATTTATVPTTVLDLIRSLATTRPADFPDDQQFSAPPGSGSPSDLVSADSGLRPPEFG